MKEQIAKLEDVKMSIWRVGLDELREQDTNARVMSPEKFNTIIGNVKKYSRLESLPVVAVKKNMAGNET